MAEPSRCETCRHWVESPVKLLASTVTPEGTFGGRVEMPGTWGDCRAIHHLSGDSHAGPEGLPEPDLAYGDEALDPNAVLAYLSDGSEYFASITTRNDFGCVLHEEKA